MKIITKVLAIVYTLFVVYASLGKYIMGIVPKNIKGGDKIAHFGAYFMFVILWSISSRFNSQEKETKKTFLKYIAVGGLLLGLLMEICQYLFTSYREMDWLDMVANSIGVLLGYLISATFILALKKQ